MNRREMISKAALLGTLGSGAVSEEVTLGGNAGFISATLIEFREKS
jgi:hypothetical protein